MMSFHILQIREKNLIEVDIIQQEALRLSIATSHKCTVDVSQMNSIDFPFNMKESA